MNSTTTETLENQLRAANDRVKRLEKLLNNQYQKTCRLRAAFRRLDGAMDLAMHKVICDWSYAVLQQAHTEIKAILKTGK